MGAGRLADNRKKGWFWDSDAVFDSGLSSYAIVVRLYLARCANKDRRSFPSLTTISEKCGVSRATVKRALKELVEAGWLSRSTRYVKGSREKTTTEYQLLTPDAREDDSKDSEVGSEGAYLGSDRTQVGSQGADRWAHTEPGVGSHRAIEGQHTEGLPNGRTTDHAREAEATAQGYPADPAPVPHESVGRSDDGLGVVMNAYERHVGMIGPTQFHKLKFWHDKGMPGAVIAEAIEAGAEAKHEQGETPNIGYIEGILRNWYNGKVFTLDEAKRRRAPPGQRGHDPQKLNQARAKIAAAYGD